jgi:hypothetical protein
MPIDYIISLKTSSDSGAALVLYEILRNVQVLCGSSNESINTRLYIIRAAEKSEQDIFKQLQAVTKIQDFSIVPLSVPINTEELKKVRKLFSGMNWDASNVSDKELSMYLADKLQGGWAYYIGTQHSGKGSMMPKMYVKRLEEHPEYSPDWSKFNDDRKNDINVDKTVEIEYGETLIEVEITPPPPPHPSPTNLAEMTDEKIRQWIRKSDERILRDDDIEVEHTAEKIFITLNINGEPETIIYNLPQ